MLLFVPQWLIIWYYTSAGPVQCLDLLRLSSEQVGVESGHKSNRHTLRGDRRWSVLCRPVTAHSESGAARANRQIDKFISLMTRSLQTRTSSTDDDRHGCFWGTLKRDGHVGHPCHPLHFAHYQSVNSISASNNTRSHHNIEIKRKNFDFSLF